jgi:Lsr2
MARRTITRTDLTDDLDGGPASATIEFGYEGSTYEIDLNDANAVAFADAMAIYVGHARKVHRSRRRNPQRDGQHDLAAVRSWAAENGYTVAARGRVPAEVLAAYAAAH